MKKAVLAALLTASFFSQQAFAAVVFATDFETGTPAGFSGLGSIQSTQALPAVRFGAQHMYNDTTLTGDAGATTLTLSGLAAHSMLSMSFDFVAWNSWDGTGSSFPSGDFFEVLLDGILLASISPNNASGTLSIAGPAALIAGPAPFGYGDSAPFFNRDTAWAVTVSNFSHSSTNAVFTFRVNGLGWQGGSDESFGLDNLVISIPRVDGGAVPEPTTWAMMLAGFSIVGSALRRRTRTKSAVAQSRLGRNHLRAVSGSTPRLLV